MSVWGAPPASGSAWSSQVEEEDGAAAVPASASFPVLGAKEEAFPSLGAAVKVKKTKKQTMSLAEFTAAPSPSARASASSGGSAYRAPSSRAGDDAYLVLPTGPRAREEGEEEGRPGLGGAFREYGGDRGGEQRESKYGSREYGERDGERERDGPRRGGFGEDGEGGRQPDGPSRADEDRDWGASKKFAPTPQPTERRGAGSYAEGERERGEGAPGGPSRADEDRNWGASKRFLPTDPQASQPQRSGGSGDSYGAPRERRDEVDADRWSRRDAAGAGSAAGAPSERPKLQLKPKAADGRPADGAAAAAGAGRASSVFGAATPVAVREVADAQHAPPPSQRDAQGGTWERRPREDVAAATAAREERPSGPAERPKLQLAPRAASAAAADPAAQAAPAAGSSIFGGARPRELALQEQGKDYRLEELKLAHGVRRADTAEEKAARVKLEAAQGAAAQPGADDASKAAVLEMELALAKLTLEIDDKVRFAAAQSGKDKEAGWRKGGPPAAKPEAAKGGETAQEPAAEPAAAATSAESA